MRYKGFDLRPQPTATLVLDSGDITCIVEVLIRLSILSSLLHSTKNDHEVPIYRRVPDSTSRLLDDAELCILDESSHQSQHDFNESIKSYIKTLNQEKLLERMLDISTLPYLPQSLDRQTLRFQKAIDSYHHCLLTSDQRHRLIVDRKRLRDDFEMLLWLQACLQKIEREQSMQSSVTPTMQEQVEVLLPAYRALNTVLERPDLDHMLMSVILLVLTLRTSLTSNRNADKDKLQPDSSSVDSGTYSTRTIKEMYRSFVSLNMENYEASPTIFHFLTANWLIDILFVLCVSILAHQNDIWNKLNLALLYPRYNGSLANAAIQ